MRWFGGGDGGSGGGWRGGELLGEYGEDVGGVGTWTVEVALDHCFEVTQGLCVDGEFSLEVVAHLLLHLVDFTNGEHTLGNNTPTLVRVGIVAHDLGSDHEGANK